MPFKKDLHYVTKGSHLMFVRQTVDYHSASGKHVAAKAIYRCDCGNYCEALMNNVRRGLKISCGCMRYKGTPKHGLSEHPLYCVWENMYSRCYNSKVKAYPNYGGRGVYICKKWRTSPETFIRWGIANGWESGLELDKDIIAKRLGIEALVYSPERCLFVTTKENLNNRRVSRILEYKGTRHTMAEWAEKFGLSQSVLHYRLKKWSLDKALTTPIRKNKTHQ